VPVPYVTLDGQDISENVTITVDDDNNTVLEIALTDSDCTPLSTPSFYKSAAIAFSPYEQNAEGKGSVRSTCGDPGSPDKAWLWKATPLPHSSHAANFFSSGN